jgi:hypothetical protein
VVWIASSLVSIEDFRKVATFKVKTESVDGEGEEKKRKKKKVWEALAPTNTLARPDSYIHNNNLNHLFIFI